MKCLQFHIGLRVNLLLPRLDFSLHTLQIERRFTRGPLPPRLTAGVNESHTAFQQVQFLSVRGKLLNGLSVTMSIHENT